MTSKLPRPYYFLLAGLLISLIYLPSLQGEFISDDNAYITDNTLLQEIPLSQAWRLFLERTNVYEWLPIRDLSFRIDWALFGQEPLGYHLHNLLLYLISCTLVGWCVRELSGLFRPQQSNPFAFALLAAVLFAVHPAHVESVAWISGRKDLLSGLFSFLALGAWARACHTGYERRFVGLALLSLALALLCKSTIIPLIAVMSLLSLCQAFWQQDAGEKRIVGAIYQATLRALPLWMMAGAIFWAHLTVGGDTGIKLAPEFTPASVFSGYFERALLILGTLTRLLLLPVDLHVLHDVYAPDRLVLHLSLAGGALAAAGWGLWASVYRRSLLGFCLIFGPLMLLPYLQLIPFSTWSLASERYLFLPVLSLAVILAQGLMGLASPTLRRSLAILLILGGSALSGLRAADWQSKTQVFAPPPTASHDHSYFLYTNSVLLPVDKLYESSRALTDRDFARAVEEVSRMRRPETKRLVLEYIEVLQQARNVRRSAAIEPIIPKMATLQWHINQVESGSDYFYDIPHVLLISKLRERLYQLYEMLEQLAPGHPFVRYNAGILAFKIFKFKEAIEHLSAAAENPGLDTASRASALNHIGLSQLRRGETQAAIEGFQQALALTPNEWRAAYNLARVHLAEDAMPEYRAALRELRRRGPQVGVSETQLEALISDLER